MKIWVMERYDDMNQRIYFVRTTVMVYSLFPYSAYMINSLMKYFVLIISFGTIHAKSLCRHHVSLVGTLTFKFQAAPGGIVSTSQLFVKGFMKLVSMAK